MSQNSVFSSADAVFTPFSSRPPELPVPCLDCRFCMYLLTIRDGLVTRHIGPYATPKQASDDLDRLLKLLGDRARWQIHALEEPASLLGASSASAAAAA